MFSTLNICTIQAELHWENPSSNLAMFEKQLKSLKKENAPDIVVLPEMFTTGFSMRTESLAEHCFGPSFNWMKEKAQEGDFAICGSIITVDNHKFYNRLYWVEPDGNVQVYDKRHLFRMAGEDAWFSEGTDRLIVEYKGWRICPMICYDLRFPLWSRNIPLEANNERGPVYDLLIYVANWPEARRDAWASLLKARAIENQVFVVGLNRVGKDGNGITYSGDSAIFSPKGESISNIIPCENQMSFTSLNLNELQEFRLKFPVHLDADQLQDFIHQEKSSPDS